MAGTSYFSLETSLLLQSATAETNPDKLGKMLDTLADRADVDTIIRENFPQHCIDSASQRKE